MPRPDMVRTALERARAAQREAAGWSQSRTDEVVAAVGWYR
ncbi:hypothetical protein [Streptomyces sp. B1I3]|nr:hypothetical protein [Streptomyces sp. B1I3]MDQ0797390.1 hypothetical protein [Streptomyces sp. B1I3]